MTNQLRHPSPGDRRRLMLVGLLSSIFGRAFAASRVVKVGNDEGFVDLDLPLIQFVRRSRGYRVAGRGTLDGKTIGLVVDVDGNWTEKPTEDSRITFYWGNVTLRSTGPDSDALAEELARLYGIPRSGLHMLTEVRAEAVGLASDPRLVESEAVKMKLFLHSEKEERYAEVFFNIDLRAQVMEIHEKDTGYRKNLIRALTERE